MTTTDENVIKLLEQYPIPERAVAYDDLKVNCSLDGQAYIEQYLLHKLVPGNYIEEHDGHYFLAGTSIELKTVFKTFAANRHFDSYQAAKSLNISERLITGLFQQLSKILDETSWQQLLVAMNRFD